MPKTTESSFNIILANVLRRKHPRWPDAIRAEQTAVLAKALAKRPDIVVHRPDSVPIVVETEFDPASTVESDAMARLGWALKSTGARIEQALAVRVPVSLASGEQHELEAAIEDDATKFEYCVYSLPSGRRYGEPTRWPIEGWLQGSVDDLATCIEHLAFSENRVARGMSILQDGVRQAAVRLQDGSSETTLAEIAESLQQKPSEQTFRMAMAIVTNALTFHYAITGLPGVHPLSQLRGQSGALLKNNVIKQWSYILDDINYWPIFDIASKMLMPLRERTAAKVLDRLAEVAGELDSLGTTSQHDLCGRMFQELITDRKFLATFYTLPSSSTLLAELAVQRLDTDWGDGKAVTSLRIADFTCGTGALLNAAYHAVLSRHRRTGKDDEEIHAAMMEQALVGTDIMPAAAHLTASVLSSAHPGVVFTDTSVMTLAYGEAPDESGKRKISIGALDLIRDEETLPLFGTDDQRLHAAREGKREPVRLPHGHFDLVIMNPPFTRPTNHESTDVPIPSFAGFETSNDEMKKMSKALRNLRAPGQAGHGNAGLASNFIDVVHAKVKVPGGIIALVLPAAFLQGESWSDARDLLGRHYSDLMIVSIAGTGSTARAFSADTGMAEILVIGTRKEPPAQQASSAPVLYMNLRERPRSVLEAATLAQAIRQTPEDTEAGRILVGARGTDGSWIRSSLAHTGCAGLLEREVALSSIGLMRGELRIPRQNRTTSLPLVRLSELGDRGLVHRDIEAPKRGAPRGPFDIDKNTPPSKGASFPMLWAHDANREKRMTVQPDSYGTPRAGREEKAAEAWKTATRLHFTLDFRINSQPLAACLTPQTTLGGTAWPNFLCADPQWEIPLALWANTTLGLVAFWWIGTRQQQGRARITISRLPELMALDPRQLNAGQLRQLHAIWEDFEETELLPANEAYRDEARQALDQAVCGDVLGISPHALQAIHLLREQWCLEPSVHGGKDTHPPGAFAPSESRPRAQGSLFKNPR